MLLSLMLGIAAIAVFAAVYVLAAWRIGASRGLSVLPVVWLGGAITFWLLSIASRAAQGLPTTFPPSGWIEQMAFYGFLAYGLCGAGLATLSVRRRLLSNPGGRASMGAIGAGVGAFLIGMLIPLAVVAMSDLSALFRRML